MVERIRKEAREAMAAQTPSPSTPQWSSGAKREKGWRHGGSFSSVCRRGSLWDMFASYLKQWRLTADGKPIITHSSALLPVRQTCT